MAQSAPSLTDRFWKTNAQPNDGETSPLTVVRQFTVALDGVEGGLAGDRKQSLLRWLRKSEVEGDLTYASPEQIRGEPVDERSLVFSVGVLLFERLTGRHPFGAEGTGQRLSRMRRAELASGVNYFPKIPAELRAVVVKAIAAFPEERWNNLSDLAKQLRGFLKLAEIPEARRAMNLRSLPAIPDAPAPSSEMKPLEGDSQLHDLFELSTREFKRQPTAAPLAREVSLPATALRSRSVLSPVAWMAAGAGLAVAAVTLLFVLQGSDETPPVEEQSPATEEREARPESRSDRASTPAAVAAPQDPVEALETGDQEPPAKTTDSRGPTTDAQPPQTDGPFDIQSNKDEVLARARSCFPELGKRALYFGATLLYDDATGASTKAFMGGTKGMTARERACLARSLIGLRAGAAPATDTMVIYSLAITPRTGKVSAKLK
ncbi:MAG: hypothetical protein KJO07_19810 [Deltaproteobacteria bacterium]|nr:hypothetical protein [Deltaproteobacteria bacterium]